MKKNTMTLMAAGVCAAVVAQVANAAVVVGWTIPTAFPTGAGNVPIGTSYSVGIGDQGAAAAGTNLSNVHQLASSGAQNTSYTSPAGNGSTYAFSSNVWKAGDYYQASLSGTGYTGMSFTWDQTRSTTGPATWTLIMSVDGGSNWTTLLASYAPIVNSATPVGAGTWSTTTYNAAYTSTISLGAAADNAASIIIRMQATVDSVNGSGVYQAGGTARIDNVFINGTAVPAPSAIALLGVAGLRRRRRN